MRFYTPHQPAIAALSTCRGGSRYLSFSSTTQFQTIINSEILWKYQRAQNRRSSSVTKNVAPPQIPRARRGLPLQKRKLNGVHRIVCVSSAKGGVGKSTIAANIALSFAKMGLRTGILDVDIFGPSIPTLFNLCQEPRISPDNKLIPLSNYGVKTMSIGYLVASDAAVVWRGPMVMKAVQQLLYDVDWGGLDVLVLDMPPGTGDVQLTIAQQISLDGALIVSTPQTLSALDACRGIAMFKKVSVPILGLALNMSVFSCPNCQSKTRIFSPGFGTNGDSASSNGDDERSRWISPLLSDMQQTEIIAELPLDPSVATDADRGAPSVVGSPDGSSAQAFRLLADRIWTNLSSHSPREHER